jgi:putative flippase GtrA
MQTPDKARKQLKLLAKYLWVGGLTTACYFLLFYLFWAQLKLPKLASVSIAYGLFLLMNFSAHRRFTFLAHGKKARAQVIRYLCLVSTSYLLTLLTVYLISDLCHFSAYTGVISACILTTIVGFIVSKKWVYC